MFKVGKVASFAMIIGSASLLGACASGAKTGAMFAPVSAETIIEPDSMLRDAITTTGVQGGKKTNPLWASKVSNEEFLAALQQSLKAHTMLATSVGKYELSAQLVQLKQPIVGFSMTVTARVKYMLKEKASGKILFDREITSPYTAKMGDAFYGPERLRLANEGAIKASITDLIKSLIAESKTNPEFKMGQPVASALHVHILRS
jgi:hypothetical protein